MWPDSRSLFITNFWKISCWHLPEYIEGEGNKVPRDPFCPENIAKRLSIVACSCDCTREAELREFQVDYCGLEVQHGLLSFQTKQNKTPANKTKDKFPVQRTVGL